MVFIHSTLKMEHALLSESLLNDARANSNLETLSDPSPSASAATATLTSSRILGSGIRPTVLLTAKTEAFRFTSWSPGTIRNFQFQLDGPEFLNIVKASETHTLFRPLN
jgi:hypothetical protein